MEPLRRLRILTWTKPRRLPGVRCSILKMEYSSLLNLMTMPGRSWVEEIIECVRIQLINLGGLNRFRKGCAADVVRI